MLNYLALGLIFVSIIGLLLSFTPLRNLEDSGASEIGYVFLFLTLASIGSRADLYKVLDAPEYLLLGVVWIALFSVILFPRDEALPRTDVRRGDRESSEHRRGCLSSDRRRRLPA